jgi:hypothetical protein
VITDHILMKKDLLARAGRLVTLGQRRFGIPEDQVGAYPSWRRISRQLVLRDLGAGHHQQVVLAVDEIGQGLAIVPEVTRADLETARRAMVRVAGDAACGRMGFGRMLTAHSSAPFES